MKIEIDKRPGGPYDRGAADSYYRRPFDPHYFRGDTYTSESVTATGMTSEEERQYALGYYENEELGNFKDYGREED